VLLLWVVPGIVALVLVRRDVRRVLGLPRTAEAAAPTSAVEDLTRDLAGYAVVFAILLGWPIVFLRRRWVAERAARYPNLFLPSAHTKGSGRVVALTIGLMIATVVVLLVLNR